MSNNLSRIVCLISLLLVPALSACSREGKPPEAKRSLTGQVRYAGTLAVKIIPPVPTAEEDLQVVFTGSANPTYRWEKNGQVIEGERGQRLAKKWFARGDDITVVVIAKGQQGSASLTIENAPPQVASVAVSPDNICRGVDITAVPSGTDADGDAIGFSYVWLVNGKELPEDTPVLKGDRFSCGDRILIKVTPNDGHDPGKEYVTQAFTVPDAVPRFVSMPPQTFDGTVYLYEAKAEDPDGGTVSYELLSGPSGMSINSGTGRLEWQVSRQSANYTIEIAAKNSKGVSAMQKYTLAITVPER